MLTAKTFPGSAVSLNYAEGPGGGPAMLLLHGLTQRWQAFLELMPALTQTHRVFAPDFRGHGKSGRARCGYRGEDYGGDILEFVDQLVQEPVIIFGHSLGGMVGVYVAACRPNLVRALIVGDSKLFLHGLNGSMYGEMFGKTLALLRQGSDFQDLKRGLTGMLLHSPVYGEVPMKSLPGYDEAHLAAWARSLSQLDPETLEMTLDGRASENWRPHDLLRRVQCPTLLMQADPRWGGLMAEEDVRQARELLRDSQHVCLQGVGHSLHMAQAPPVVRGVTNFLASLPA